MTRRVRLWVAAVLSRPRPRAIRAQDDHLKVAEKTSLMIMVGSAASARGGKAGGSRRDPVRRTQGPRRHAAGPRGGGRRAASLYARLPPAKNRRPQPDAGESSRSKLPARARCTSTCPRSLSISVFRAFLGENARPAREVGDPAGVGPGLAGSAGRGRRRADVVKYWTGYCAGPGWSPARPRRCSRAWRIARYGRSSSRTTVLGLVLSLRPSAIRVLNSL